MNIICVNISKQIERGIPIIEATQRKWVLDLERASSMEFVIGVANGEIKGCYQLINAEPDWEEPARVQFELQPCTSEEELLIEKQIKANNIGLKYFVTKYINL